MQVATVEAKTSLLLGEMITNVLKGDPVSLLFHQVKTLGETAGLQANLTSNIGSGGGSVPARGFKLISLQTLGPVEVLCLPEASS